jgi:protein gp37
VSDRSAIEWTDASWNPIRARNRATGRLGWHCVHKSDGCRNCYAESFNLRLGTKLPYKPGHVPEDVEILLDPDMLLLPLKWKRPRRIFVGSMTDLFADFVTDEMLDRVFAVMALASQHSFQLLTKRPDRMRAYLAAAHRDVAWVLAALEVVDGYADSQQSIIAAGFPLPNVWLGTSVEDQAAADERREDFRAVPAAVKFVSYEPALEPVDWSGWEFVQQIISGGESGPRARPSHPDWHRDTRDFCAAHGIAFFFKQWVNGGLRGRSRLAPW